MGIPISAMIIRDKNTPLRLVHKVGIHYMYRKPVNLMLIIKIYWLYPVFYYILNLSTNNCGTTTTLYVCVF